MKARRIVQEEDGGGRDQGASGRDGEKGWGHLSSGHLTQVCIVRPEPCSSVYLITEPFIGQARTVLSIQFPPSHLPMLFLSSNCCNHYENKTFPLNPT